MLAFFHTTRVRHCCVHILVQVVLGINQYIHTVFTVNVKRQLLPGLIMATGHQHRAKLWDSYKISEVQLNGLQLSRSVFLYSSFISSCLLHTVLYLVQGMALIGAQKFWVHVLLSKRNTAIPYITNHSFLEFLFLAPCHYTGIRVFIEQVSFFLMVKCNPDVLHPMMCLLSRQPELLQDNPTQWYSP